MRHLIGYELLKLCKKKLVIIVLINLFFLNALLLYNRIYQSNTENYSLVDVKEVYSEIRKKSLTGQLTNLEYLRKKYENDNIIGAVNEVYTHVKELNNYSIFLEQIEKQTQEMKEVSIFAKKDSFIYRNIIATSDVYKKLENIQHPAVFLDSINLFADNLYADILLIFSIIIISLQVFLSDRECGILPLLKATENGNRKLILAKIITVQFISIGLVVIYSVLELGILFIIFKCEGLNLPIQMIPNYIHSSLKISVKEYIFCFIICKCVIMQALVALLFIGTSIFKNYIYTGIFTIFFLLVEYLLWNKIDIHSTQNFLKYVNFFAVMDMTTYFKDYNNINLFEYPVNIAEIGIVFTVTFILINLNLGRYLEKKMLPNIKIKNYFEKNVRKKEKVLKVYPKIVYYELYKLFIVNKGLYVLLFCAIIQIITFQNTNYFITSEEYYYQYYSVPLEGKLSEKKEKFLKSELNKIEKREENLEKYIQLFNEGKISQDELSYYETAFYVREEQLQGLQRAYEQYEQLKEMLAQGKKVTYLYVTPYRMLLGSREISSLILDVLKVLILIFLVLIPYGTYEKRCKMEIMLNLSCKGKKNIRRRKYMSCVCYLSIVAFLLIFPKNLSIIQKYELKNMNASIESVFWGTSFLSRYSIILVVIGAILLQSILIIGIGCIVFKICQRKESI